MSKLYIAFDVGKQGAIVAMIDNSIVEITAMPVKGKYYLASDIRRILENLVSTFSEEEDVIAVIEDVHSKFMTSAKSNFQFGFGAGLLEGLCIGLAIPFVKVQPKEWQAYSWKGIQPVQIGSGVNEKTGKQKFKTDTKATSLIAAQRLYPKVDLTKSARAFKAHDGIVDALLICHYAKHKF